MLFFCDFFYDSWEVTVPISAIISGGFGGMGQWPPGHETLSKSESSLLLNLHKSSPLASREGGGHNRHVTINRNCPPTEKRNPRHLRCHESHAGCTQGQCRWDWDCCAAPRKRRHLAVHRHFGCRLGGKNNSPRLVADVLWNHEFLAKLVIFHQARIFPERKIISLPKLPFGGPGRVRSLFSASKIKGRRCQHAVFDPGSQVP